VTKQELSSQESSSFKKDVDNSSQKTIKFPVVCSQIDTNIKPGYSLSNSCIFGIFVQNSGTEQSSEVDYELKVEDVNISHMLLKNYFQNVRLGKEETRFYHYNYQAKKLSDRKLLHFTIDGKYGLFKGCIKRASSKPAIQKFDSSDKCDWSGLVNADNHGLTTK
jgi:hypothetical protein